MKPETRRPSSLLLQAASDRIDELLHRRRVEIPRRERYASEALQRAHGKFPSEKNIARTVLDKDIPETEQHIDAELLILQTAGNCLTTFLMADFTTRKRMIRDVMNEGGIEDRFGRWVWL